MIIEGKSKINLFRMKMLLIGLLGEIRTGMQLTRGRSAYSIIKSEYGLKGSKANVYNQFAVLYNAEYEKVQNESVRV